MDSPDIFSTNQLDGILPTNEESQPPSKLIRLSTCKISPVPFNLNMSYASSKIFPYLSKNTPNKYSNAGTQTDTDISEKSEANAAVLQSFLIKQFTVINTRLERIENTIKSTKHLDLGIPLPISTIEGMDELEMKMADEHFRNKFTEYVKKIHGKDEEYDRIMKHLFSDDLLFSYNWNGEKGKQALKWLSVFSEILFDAIGNESLAAYENKIKIIIKRTHQRKLKRKSRENHI